MMRHELENVSVNSTQANHKPTQRNGNSNIHSPTTCQPTTRQPTKCIEFDSSSVQSPACRCRKLLTRRNHCYYCDQAQQQQLNEQRTYNNKSLDSTAEYLQIYNTLPNKYFCEQNQQKQLQLCLEPQSDRCNHRKNSNLSVKMLPNGESEDEFNENENSNDDNNNNNNNNNNERNNDSPEDNKSPEDEENPTNDLEFIDLEQTYYQDKVFWCLKRNSILRHWAIRLTLSPYFERITIFIILMNCVTLGLYDPYDELCQSKRCQVLEGLEMFIYAYFLGEMLIKMLAFGIFGKLGYLSEGWNRLDFFIVVAGTFELVYGDGEFLSSVRAVRVLRPLRAINRVPSIRILVTLLLDTLPMLGNVFILCILILMVFAIIGVQLWHGILRNRCTLDLPSTMPSYFYNSSTFPKDNYYIPKNGDEWGLICPEPEEGSTEPPFMCFREIPSLDLSKYNCTKIYTPGTNLSHIPTNETNCVDWNKFYSSCRDVGQNPQYGAISFDNSGEAFIAIFQAMTLEGWVDIMYYLQDAHSSWVWVYFVALIVLGSYFLTNLCLVVVATQFSETRQRESALMEEAGRKARSTSSTIFTATDTENKGCYNQILSIMKHYIQRGCRRLKTRLFGEKNLAKRKRKGRHLLQKSKGGGAGGRSKRLHVNGGSGGVHYHHHHHHHIHHHHLHLCNSNSMATTGTMATTNTNTNNARATNGDLNVYGDETRYCPNAVSTMEKKKKAAMETRETNGDTNKSTDGQTVPSKTTIKPTPPSIIIDECDHQPPSTHPMNTTALIIPDTTVVICHSSSLPGALQSQSPLTTVSLFPSLSKIHQRASLNESEFDSDQTTCACRYHSMGDSQCCPDLNKDLNKYERDVLNDSDMYDSDNYDWDDDEMDWETTAEKKEREENKWINQKRIMVVLFCESDCFKVSIMTAIFLNTVTMAMEHYMQPESMTMALEIFNTIFTTVFLIEFVLKFTGYGFYGYIKNAFNVFDGIVVIISIIELAGSRTGGVSILRTFRLMRIFKLIRFLPTLQKQIQVMLETLDSVMTFLGLLTIFIFTSSILGMHLFGGVMKVDGIPVRHNFDDLLWSLITVFQVLTQEDWNAVLYDAMRSTSKWAAVYFVLLMIIGNYILFNLLVAILVEGFSSETEGILSTPSKSPLLKNQTLTTTGIPHGYQQKDGEDIFDPMTKNDKTQSLPNITDDCFYMDDTMKLEDGLQKGFGNVSRYRRMSSSESAIHRQVRFNAEITITPIPDEEEEMKYLEDNNDPSYEQMFRYDDEEEEEKKKKKRSSCKIGFFSRRKDWSLYIFSPKNRVRMAAVDLIAHQWFDNVVLFFILLNCIIMALERPSIKPGSTERKIIDISNHMFTIVFTIEMLIKIFAAGFCFGEKTTYLKNSWNRIDFVLVIISLVDIFVTYVVQSKSGVLGVLKVFRAFRTLRPLRVISRAPGLKIVVETLIHSLVPIGNLLIVGLVFFTIFGILGVQLFKGKFHHCTGVDDDKLEFIITRTDCLTMGGSWANKKYNFDNLFQALFTLFVFSTKDGWVALMYDGIDAIGIDKQPKRNANRWAFLYFVAFLLIAGFVVINMVVGVIIDNFQKCRVLVEEEELEAGHTITSSHPASDEDDDAKRTFGEASIMPIANLSSQSLTTISTASGGSALRTVRRKCKIKTQLEQNLAAAGYGGSGRPKTVSFSEEQETNHPESTSSRARSVGNKNCDEPKHLDEYSKVRRKCYYIVSHYKFDLVIAVIIGLNVIMMAIEHDKMSAKMISLLSILNYIFTAIFILEAIFKIWGFGPRMFFAQGWNQLDIVIVFLSIIGIIFEELNSELPINPTIIRIMRVLRIARVLKILKAADGIQKLLNCVTEAIPQVGNLSVLFLLIFFIYSALGIELFGDLDCNLDTCYGISRHAHFQNFGYALLTLFRISTGDNWSGLLKDCVNVKLCPEECPMMPYMAPVYYSTFVLASQFVLVNVVVAVLMKQLEDAKELVSPGTSQASGLNSPDPTVDTTQAVDYGDNNNDNETKNNRDSIELRLRRNGRTKSPESTCDENKPLIPSENTEMDYENFDMNLVLLENAKETTIDDVPDGKTEMQEAFQGNTNHEPASIYQPSEAENVNEQINNKDTDCIQNVSFDEDEVESKNCCSNNNNENIEQTVNELLDMVVKIETEQPRHELDSLDLDIIAAVEALSGLRDSVVSTCV